MSLRATALASLDRIHGNPLRANGALRKLAKAI